MNDIGWAVKQMQNGDSVRRTGWNGKGMYIYILKYDYYEPVVTMFTAQGKHQPGWLCSQADLLAIDWESVEQKEINK